VSTKDDLIAARALRRKRAPDFEPLRFIGALVAQSEWPEECVDWPYARNPDGYGNLHVAPGGPWKAAHRYACEQAHGLPPTPKHEAAHSCGRGASGCVNPRHLRWATSAENKADMERQARAKISPETVPWLRAVYIPGDPEFGAAALARRHGMTRTNMSRLLNGHSYRETPHVAG
jgi:hypothetical protein